MTTIGVADVGARDVNRFITVNPSPHGRPMSRTITSGTSFRATLIAETASGPASMVSRKLQEKLIELAQHNGWPVTFSTGIVTFEIIPASVDEMLEAVDAQMYLAKKQGKNRTRHKTVAHDKIVPAIVNS